MSRSKVALMVVAVLVAAAAAWRILQFGSDEPLAGAQTRADAEFVVGGSAAPVPSAESRPHGATVVPIHAAPFRDAADPESRNLWHVRGRVVERPAGDAAADPNADGPPVAGVKVTLKAFPGRERREESQVKATAITGMDGSFDLAVGAPTLKRTFHATIDSEVWSGDAGEFFVGIGDPEPAPLLIRADRCDATIFGTIKDVDGAPIVGAKIGWAKKVLSDDEGAYRLPIRSSRLSRQLEHWASAPGLATERREVEWPAAGESLRCDFTLDAECAVVGVVRRPDGAPLEGATVSSDASGDRMSVFTAADGRFRLGGFSLKRRGFVPSIQVEAPGYLSAERTPFFLDRERRYEIRMVVGTTVRGIVVDEGGVPLAGVEVSFGGHHAFSGRDGRFTVMTQPGVTGLLGAERSGMISASQVIDVPPEGLDGLRIVMGAGHRAGGRVEDELGRPIGGLSVAGRQHGGRLLWTTKTAADGRFTLEALPAEGLEAEVYGSGYRRRTTPIFADRDDVVIVMKQNGKLAGTVVDAATMEPLTRFNVRIVGLGAISGGDFGRNHFEWWGESGAQIRAKDGVWRIDDEDLPPGGVFGVEIRAEGFARGTYGRLVVETDPDPKAHVMALKKGSTIGGVVVFGSGRPVMDAKVSALSADDKAREPAKLRAEASQPEKSDSAGKFVIRDAPGGMIFLRVDFERRPPFYAGPFSAPEGGTVGDLRIEMPGRAEILGVVVDPEGRPLQGEFVRLQLFGGPTGVESESVNTDAEGRFAFRGLSAGRYFVDSHVTGASVGMSGREVVLAETDAQEVRLPADAPCSVQILLEGLDPLPRQMVVEATPSGDSPRGVGRARRILYSPPGVFEVDGLDEGEYRFSVSSYSKHPANGSAVAKVVPGAPVEVKIKLDRPKRGE